VSEDMKAEMQHWQARCDDLSTANERLREERDDAKMELIAVKAMRESLIEELQQSRATVDRLRLHIAQGVEL
jgi:chromosome segregation ATPase